MDHLQKILQSEYDAHCINYLDKKFGVTFLARAWAIVDLAKALKIPIEESRRLKRMEPKPVEG